MRIFTHYGSDKFDPDLFIPITNDLEISKKPQGGLWTSDRDSTSGWKHYCESETFRTNSLTKHFNILIKEDARILTLKSLSDAESLICKYSNNVRKDIDEMHYNNDFNNLHYWYELFMGNEVDWIKVASDYDMIDFYVGELYWAMYSWDCDCQLIMNLDVIIPYVEETTA